MIGKGDNTTGATLADGRFLEASDEVLVSLVHPIKHTHRDNGRVCGVQAGQLFHHSHTLVTPTAIALPHGIAANPCTLMGNGAMKVIFTASQYGFLAGLYLP